MHRSIIPVLLLLIMVAAGCNTARYKKLDSGLEYKIVAGKGDKAINDGNFVKMTITQFYNDSLMATPYDTIPQIIMIDSMRIPAEYVKIFLQAKQGDSIATRISTDTIAKHNPLPPFAKAGQYFGTRFKIIDIYTNQEDAEKEGIALRERAARADSIALVQQKEIDDKTIQDYLKKNNITAQKTPQGTYVEVINEGAGKKVDSGSAASVLYKGMLLDGRVFDQSYDSSGNPKDPFTFVVGAMGAIEGWSDGMVYFKEGGNGRLFIPSGRAYGSQGAGADIGPNTPIMFEVKITKVQSQEVYQKEMAERRKQMEQEREKASQGN